MQTNGTVLLTDYYKTLGVAPGATQAELKAAFRQQSKIFHPDAGGGADADSEARFREVQEAYGVLSRPQRRRAYDRAWAHFTRQGLAAGASLPQGAAVAWHPEYHPRRSASRKVLRRRGSLLLGLAVVGAVSAALGALLFSNQVDNETPVSGKEGDVAWTQRPAAPVAMAQTPHILDTPVAASDGPEIRFTVRREPMPEPVREIGKQPPKLTVEKAALKYTALLKIDAPVPAVRKPVPVLAIRKVAPDSLPRLTPVSNRPLTDTEPPPVPLPVASGTGKPQQPGAKPFGYIVFVVKRHLRYEAVGYTDSQIVKYTSPLILYGYLDPGQRNGALLQHMAACSRAESAMANRRAPLKMTFSISPGTLKTFRTAAEAQGGLRREGKTIHLGDMQYY